MSYEVVASGSTVPIRVLLYDGATAQTGETVVVSIERLSDGKYWDGAAWQSSYQPLAMSELSGNVHLAGMYQYLFVTPTSPDRYDWRVTFDGDIQRAFAGRLSTEDNWNEAMAELTAPVSDTPTMKKAIMEIFMHLHNATTSGGPTQSELELKIRNAAGTVVMKADETWSETETGGTFTKAKLQAGP